MPDQHTDQRLRAARTWARYSGIGFQMAAIIGLATYGGWWADGRTTWQFPLFTLVGSLGGVSAGFLAPAGDPHRTNPRNP